MHLSPVKETTLWRFATLDQPESDLLAAEVPVSLIYNGISHAVMMASPENLEAFALGFTLSEQIVYNASDIYEIDVQPVCSGVEIHIRISAQAFWRLKQHRRNLSGRTGCGLCGKESLESAIGSTPQVPHTQHFALTHYEKILTYFRQVEVIGAQTGCTHAAIWVSPQGDFLFGVEDVGRHVALDKLLGLRHQAQQHDGALLMSSRASYDIVQKAARMGVEILFTVSAPTAMAVQLAQDAGMTLCAFCRPGRGSVYTNPRRLILPSNAIP